MLCVIVGSTHESLPLHFLPFGSTFTHCIQPRFSPHPFVSCATSVRQAGRAVSPTLTRSPASTVRPTPMRRPYSCAHPGPLTLVFLDRPRGHLLAAGHKLQPQWGRVWRAGTQGSQNLTLCLQTWKDTAGQVAWPTSLLHKGEVSGLLRSLP